MEGDTSTEKEEWDGEGASARRSRRVELRPREGGRRRQAQADRADHDRKAEGGGHAAGSALSGEDRLRQGGGAHGLGAAKDSRALALLNLAGRGRPAPA